MHIRDNHPIFFWDGFPLLAAPVVRRMFEMCAAGIGARSIATTLNNEGILSPKEYTRFRKHNPERDGELIFVEISLAYISFRMCLNGVISMLLVWFSVSTPSFRAM